MVDMGQLERGLYSRPKVKKTFYLINKLSGEILAIYKSNPLFSPKTKKDIFSICPDFWDNDNYKLTTNKPNL